MTLAEKIKIDLFSETCNYVQDLEEYKTKYLNSTFFNDAESCEAAILMASKKCACVEKAERVCITLARYVDLAEGTTWEMLDELASKANHAQSDEEYTAAEQEFMSRIKVID